MKRGTYLRAIGIIELIGFGIGLIVYIVYWFKGVLDSITPFLRFFYFMIIIFFGPATGVLFLTVADTYEATYELYEKSKNKDNNSNNSSVFKEYVVGDIVTSSEPLLSYDKKTQIPALTTGRVTKIYTDMAEVEFKVEDKTVIANVPYKSINKM